MLLCSLTTLLHFVLLFTLGRDSQVEGMFFPFVASNLLISEKFSQSMIFSLFCSLFGFFSLETFIMCMWLSFASLQ